MRKAQVAGSLHFRKAAARALDAGVPGNCRVQALSHVLGADDQLDMAIIELIDQPGESLQAVHLIRPEARDAGHEYSMVAARQLDVVRGPARPLAQLREIEPGGAGRDATRIDPAPFHF